MEVLRSGRNLACCVHRKSILQSLKHTLSNATYLDVWKFGIAITDTANLSQRVDYDTIQFGDSVGWSVNQYLVATD